MNLTKKAKTGIIAAAAIGLLLLLLPDGQKWKFTIEPGKVGKKILSNEGFISAGAVEKMIRTGEKNIKILDIRNTSAREKGTIKGSEHVPLMMLMSKYYIEKNLDKKNTYILMCSNGTQSIQTWLLLNTSGYNTYAIKDGFKGWVAAVKDISLYENITAAELKRKAAAQGGVVVKAPVKAKRVIRAKPAVEEEEGC